MLLSVKQHRFFQSALWIAFVGADDALQGLVSLNERCEFKIRFAVMAIKTRLIDYLMKQKRSFQMDDKNRKNDNKRMNLCNFNYIRHVKNGTIIETNVSLWA